MIVSLGWVVAAFLGGFIVGVVTLIMIDNHNL